MLLFPVEELSAPSFTGIRYGNKWQKVEIDPPSTTSAAVQLFYYNLTGHTIVQHKYNGHKINRRLRFMLMSAKEIDKGRPN